MYEFNEKLHRHTLDGKSLTGVTTVLGVISKGDGLIQWSANEAVKYITDNAPMLDTTEDKSMFTETMQALIGNYIVTPEMLEEAKTAWKGTRDNAGDKGKEVHSLIEGIIKRAIAQDGYVNCVEAHEHAENHQVTHFINWACDNHIKFLESEKNIYSKELWIGGIVDFVYEKDGEIYIGDIKTAKAIYPSNFWQTSAYQYCLQEMGMYPNIKGFTIVRLGKDGTFETENNFSYDDNIEGFKSALTIYRKLNAISPVKKTYTRTKKLTTK